ncbi:hypothetical protein [Sphingopyxis flava]|uniref:Uncharacterized protein n=1 Tax=Sphingopyxis flava TaxID=1507287 RepID=A0A1T5ACR5_9SPHN|nr:hypothetical protein [Sphingopyxis flava]SKB32764.1 hypothetical protein SAMN06295937_1003106 [Sphingopyxis flava]
MTRGKGPRRSHAALALSAVFVFSVVLGAAALLIARSVDAIPCELCDQSLPVAP